MPGECNHLCFCPIEGVIDIISKKWALLIINGLCNRGKLRFNDLMKELGGISPKTLSDTLKDLQNEKLIKRQSFAEIPPRVEYTLTKDGVKLGKAIMPLIKWAAARELAKEKCPTVCQGTPAHRVMKSENQPTVPLKTGDQTSAVHSSMSADEFVKTRVLPKYRGVVSVLRELLREVAPDAKETISHGIPAYRRKRIIAVISPTKKGITLAFSRGAEFEDKYGILEGEGRVSKNVRIRSVDAVDKEALRYYIRQAVELDSKQA
ncbi:MAG: winged helix-turn-helix transcriptional regulator [Candidatus Bathyarchaeia archaeon]